MIDLEIEYTQRYYHFVTLKGNKSIIKKEFFNVNRINETKRIKLESDSIIYHYSITTNTLYYRGETEEKAPYTYDIILIEYSKVNIILLGFPFKKLAMELVNSLLSTYKILAKSNFIKVDMNKLLKANNKHTDLYYNQNHFLLGGVFISLAGDSFLSTVKLVGDKPLDSDIYKNYFKERLSRPNTKNTLDKCILKSTVGINYEDLNYQISSSLHIDKFGNYKVYVQNRGKNLLSMPSIFEFLNDLDCLEDTPNNPVFHISNEE